MGFPTPNWCFELSSVYAIVLLLLYVSARDSTIPLTYSRMFDNWGGVRDLFLRAQAPVSWPALNAQLWCPEGIHSSQQCQCFADYYNNTYWPEVLSSGLVSPQPPSNASAVLAAQGRKHATGIIEACLRLRPSWRKDSCGDFCRVHLATPVILACVYMSILFSGVAYYRSAAMRAVRCYVPPLLGAATIGLHLALDRTGGIIGTLSVLSVMLESFYLGPHPPWKSETFWSYHRFFLGALAVWAAVTHQARDVYLVMSYTLLSFCAGFTTYIVSLIKQGSPSQHSGAVCLHLYVGVVAVIACFILLLQQNWYLSSPLWSSVVSPFALMAGFCQCLSQAPFGRLPLPVNLTITITLLTVSFAAVVVDLTGGGV